MKKIILTFLLACIMAVTFGQAPNAFNYQAVLRSTDNEIIANKQVGIKIEIVSMTTENVVYVETHSTTTTDIGLINLKIGKGTTSDNLSTIDWGVDSYKVQISLDEDETGSYLVMGESQLLSVPYAMYSANAGQTNEKQQLSIIGDVITLSDGGSVILPTDQVDDADADATNEIQDLELIGSTLKITNNLNATEINLAPFVGTNTDEQTLSISGNIISLENGGSVTLPTDQVDDADADAANEIQTLSITGNTISLTNGGSVTLPTDQVDDADADATNEIQTLSITGNTISLENGGSVTLPTDQVDDADADATNEIQTLSITGNTISLTNGGSVDIPETFSGNYADLTGTPDLSNYDDDVTDDFSGDYADLTNTPTLSTVATTGNYTDLSGTPDLTGYDTNASDDFSGSYSDLSDKPTLTGDVTGGLSLNSVVKIQGNDVSANMPANGQILKWNSGTSVWEPSDDALGAAGSTDGVVSSVGITGTTTKTLTLSRTEGLGDLTASFTDNVDDADADATNELQNLTYYPATGFLAISNGNFIGLPDVSATNEIQTISLTGTNLNISGSGGNTISLSSLQSTFVTSSGVTSNVNGIYASDDFVFGSSQLDDDGNSTHDNRMFFDKSKGVFRAGTATGTTWDVSNSGDYSSAFGYVTTASGFASNAFGSFTIASGNRAFASGDRTEATGSYSFAGGSYSIAGGDYSVALGNEVKSSGNNSAAFGLYTESQSYLSFTIGRFNEKTGTASSWVATDPLFVIGNGAGSWALSNAVTVLKNGNMGIGVSDPDATLEINGTMHYTDGNQGAGKVLTSDASGNASWSIVSVDYNDLSNKPTLAGDITGDIGSNIVAKIQGNSVSSNAPANGQVLKWNETNLKWEPSDDALGAAGSTDGVVSLAAFTGTTTKTLTLSRTEGLSEVTATFIDNVDDADASITNEIQNISLSGTVLSISSGSNVDLNILQDGTGTDDQNLVLTDDVLSIENGTGSVDLSVYIDDADASITNEIQDISLSGTVLSISSGSDVDLSILQDGTGTDNQNLTLSGAAGSATVSESFAIDIEDGTSVNIVEGSNISMTRSGSNLTINTSDVVTSLTNGGGDVSGKFSNLSVNAINGVYFYFPSTPTDGQILSYSTGGSYFRAIDPVETFSVSSNIVSNSGYSVYDDDDFVFGSNQLDYNADGNKNYRFFFDNSKAAFRAGHTYTKNWNVDSLGTASFAGGRDTKAKGDYSTAFGYQSTATGIGATALGYSTNATANYSTALGQGSKASGLHSLATGSATTASGQYSSAGGYLTEATADYAIAYGIQSDATGEHSVAGGYQSRATANYAFTHGNSALASGIYSVSLGDNNTASGLSSFAIGRDNTAEGEYSVAMGYGSTTNSTAYCGIALGRNVHSFDPDGVAIGYYAQANAAGAFAFGDASSTTQLNNVYTNSFMARFDGGYRLFSSDDLSTGVYLAAGGASWASVSDSTKKENFKSVSGELFLNKIKEFNLTSWNYKGQDALTHRHYGPMAQDFYAAFGNDGIGTVGCDTLIATADFMGVNFIAIQALEKRTQELRETQAKLENKINEIDALKAEVAEMKKYFEMMTQKDK